MRKGKGKRCENMKRKEGNEKKRKESRNDERAKQEDVRAMRGEERSGIDCGMSDGCQLASRRSLAVKHFGVIHASAEAAYIDVCVGIE